MFLLDTTDPLALNFTVPTLSWLILIDFNQYF